MAHSSAIRGWTEANQRHLAAALSVVRTRVEQRLEKKEKPDVMRTAEAELARAHRAMPAAPALDLLVRIFELSPFETELLLLVAGVELSSTFGELCGNLQGDPHKSYATFGLALSVLPAPHWSALTPASPLKKWRLVEQLSGQSMTTSPLRIDERVLGFLTGLDFVDERLAGFIDRLTSRSEMVPSHQELLDRWALAWHKDQPKKDWPIVQLIGPSSTEKRALARAAAEQLNLEVYTVEAHTLPMSPNELEALARVWMREAMLRDAALLIAAEGIEGSDSARGSMLRTMIDRMVTPVIVTLRERKPLSDRPVLSFDVNKPSAVEQISLWRSALGPQAETANGAIEDLVSSFDLGATEIGSARLFATQSANDQGALKKDLWRACRLQARPQLDELAQRIKGGATWDDIVLPVQQKEILKDVIAHVRHRRLVYETWNFSSKGSRGLGIGALFAGVSGTGKTMAAEVIASELDLDLYRVDLSQVVSKYIGETEKNLRKIFDAAESGGVILLFDEADALFGKRSEVKDSHDRYANIEISYLLQRMESYRGLAILTTNMKEALDNAFLRRLRFVVQFPFPDTNQRAEIWRRVFPKETPTLDLQIEKLAKLAVAGGNIRNVALYATFIAANEGTPVTMVHLQRAARVELAKLERPPTEAEIGGWR